MPRQSKAIEALEPRQFLSVSQDSNGWTVVAPPPGAHVIYVSNSTGDDHNDGLSPARPVNSLHHAQMLLRNRSGDQMLLKRGDVWHDGLGIWTVSGKSDDTPIVVGAYGAGPRPRLDTGTDSAVILGMTSTPEIDHLAIIGLDFHSDARDPGSPTFSTGAASNGNLGLDVVSKTDGLLIEDCAFRDYGTNATFWPYFGTQSNVVIRRSQFLDAYSTDSSHSEGLYANGVQGITLEGNVFDHNGWNAAVPGAWPTIFNHDAYLSNTNAGVVVRDNIFANAGSHGLQARSGGDVEDNLFLNDPLGMSYGLVNGSPVTPGGVSGVVNGNVFIGTRDVGGQSRGVGLELGNTSPDAQTLVSNNIFTDSAGGAFPAIMLEYGQGVFNPDQAVGINNLTIDGNIVHAWTAGLSIQSGMQPGGTGADALNHLTVRNNDFQAITGSQIIQQGTPMDAAEEPWSDNTYSAASPSSGWVQVQSRGVPLAKWEGNGQLGGQVANPDFVDPARTADSYGQTLGATAAGNAAGTGTGTAAGSGLAAFLAGARQQSSQDWQPQYAAAAAIAYERAGFEQAGQAPRNWLPPAPPTAAADTPASVSTTTEGTDLTLAVTYAANNAANKGIDLSSIGSANVVLVGPHGVKIPGALVGVTGGGTATTAAGTVPVPAVATYRFAAPAGAWRLTDAGKYALVLQGQQVRSTDGFYAEATTLGSLRLRVTKAPAPPTVRAVTFHVGTRLHPVQSLTVRFGSNVGASIVAAGASAMTLTDAAGNVVGAAVTTVAYNPKTRTATWTFPGEADGALPAGTYRVTLSGSAITDAAGRHLDGNRDGVGGDDYVWKGALRSKAFTTRQVDSGAR